MKKWLKFLALAAGCCCQSGVVKADLLGVTPGYPQINFASTAASAVNYDPATGTFSVDALPYSIDFALLGPNSLIVRDVYKRQLHGLPMVS